MQITHEFEVARPVDTVWEMFQDVPSVAQCLPGAEMLGQGEDGSYDGKLSVKLGPMAASFEGKATVAPDAQSKSAVIDGKAYRLIGLRPRVALPRLEHQYVSAVHPERGTMTRFSPRSGTRSAMVPRQAMRSRESSGSSRPQCAARASATVWPSTAQNGAWSNRPKSHRIMAEATSASRDR